MISRYNPELAYDEYWSDHCWPEMAEDPSGDWIRYEEVQEVLKEASEALKTALDYAQDTSEGSLWVESYKQGKKALVQVDPEMGQRDFERFNSALKMCQKALK